MKSEELQKPVSLEQMELERICKVMALSIETRTGSSNLIPQLEVVVVKTSYGVGMSLDLNHDGGIEVVGFPKMPTSVTSPGERVKFLALSQEELTSL